MALLEADQLTIFEPICSPLSMDKIYEYVTAIDIKRQRLGWNEAQAQEFLRQHFGKQSRWLLTDDELVQALKLFEVANPADVAPRRKTKVTFNDLLQRMGDE